MLKKIVFIMGALFALFIVGVMAVYVVLSFALYRDDGPENEVEDFIEGEAFTSEDDLLPRQLYGEFQTDIKKQLLLSSTYDAALRLRFFNWLKDDMYAHWDTTKWDYNGVSREPGRGTIACGYFITTLLQDMGFELDRIRLSQAASSVMIRELTVDVKISTNWKDIDAHVKAGPDHTVYILGLNNHVGFILHETDKTYFFHSSAYYSNDGVDLELVDVSDALADATYFMIGNLSDSTKTMNAWQQGE